MAERAGFEPAWEQLAPHPISSRRRYDHFGTSPITDLIDYFLVRRAATNQLALTFELI